jgi:hypothetical protein
MRVHISAVLIPIAVSLFFGACAARQERSIDVRQSHDEIMGCMQLDSEISASRRMIGSYGPDLSQQSDRNQWALLGALVNPLMLMQIDGGDAAIRETNAFSDRIRHLENLRIEKECKSD